MLVRKVIKQRKDDRKGLLHAQEPMKGPFAMELKDWLQVWWIACEPAIGDYMLACVVALCGTIPEEQPSVYSYRKLYYRLAILNDLSVKQGMRDVRMLYSPVLQELVLHIYRQLVRKHGLSMFKALQA